MDPGWVTGTSYGRSRRSRTASRASSTHSTSTPSCRILERERVQRLVHGAHRRHPDAHRRSPELAKGHDLSSLRGASVGEPLNPEGVWSGDRKSSDARSTTTGGRPSRWDGRELREHADGWDPWECPASGVQAGVIRRGRRRGSTTPRQAASLRSGWPSMFAATSATASGTSDRSPTARPDRRPRAPRTPTATSGSSAAPPSSRLGDLIGAVRGREGAPAETKRRHAAVTRQARPVAARR